MSNKIVITSFAPEGFALYGRNFLRSFDALWPQDVRLVVYIEEGQAPLAPMARRLMHVERLSAVPGWPEFFASLPPSRRGLSPLVPGGYHVGLDARMARKTFMQAAAVRSYGIENAKVFWLDADTITHAPVPATLLDELLPDGKFCCYLGRDGRYTETGFLGFAADHPLAAPFFADYVDVFTSGRIFEVFEEWHDCIAFDDARSRFPAVEFVDIGVAGAAAHVFVNSRLGAYMDHLKGDGRKKLGRSPAKDLAAPRAEAYWRA